jgi:hypothetical protein
LEAGAAWWARAGVAVGLDGDALAGYAWRAAAVVCFDLASEMVWKSLIWFKVFLLFF